MLKQENFEDTRYVYEVKLNNSPLGYFSFESIIIDEALFLKEYAEYGGFDLETLTICYVRRTNVINLNY